MLEGETRLVVAGTKLRNKTYRRFLIHIPPKIARDSQFPFKPNQTLKVEIDRIRRAVVLSEANNPNAHQQEEKSVEQSTHRSIKASHTH